MKKIMFNDNYCLTQAVLDGRKTMTRRIIKNVPVITFYSTKEFHLYDKLEDKYHQVNAINKYAQYQVGEVVAIAQQYQTIFNEKSLYKKYKLIDIIKSEAVAKGRAGWNNKMFVRAEEMPHHIRITNIRVERLQDISDEDCLREGIIDNNDIISYQVLNNCFFSPREAFEYLIDKVSGKGTWESNPYVFVYEFELVE